MEFVSGRLLDVYKVGALMQKHSEVAVDTETDGLSRFRKVIGVSFCFSEIEYTYIPLYKWNGTSLVDYWSDKDSGIVRGLITKWLKQPKKWIGHNIVFDIISLENEFGVNIVSNVFSDTALLHHTCISEDPPHGLKTLAAQYVDPLAGDAQEDLAENVRLNGGLWKKDNKEFFKGDTAILGKYGALDPYYTFKLHKLWYPEIEMQGLQNLWFNEVLPLVEVMYQLNSTGLKIDLPYFEQLKLDVEKNIKTAESNIYNTNIEALKQYELSKIKDELKLTSRSAIGKILLERGLAIINQDKSLTLLDGADSVIYQWYCEKNQQTTVFNLDSKDDLAYLLFTVLKLPIIKETKSGSPATDKVTLDALLEDAPEDDTTLKTIKKLSKDKKLLSTYIIPLIENSIEGRVYPQFNQIGTSSGRFTSSEPINFQTLPRDDLRIKRGLIADDGYVIVNADFSSLEPRIFAHVSDESEIKRVYTEGLDLYSHVYKMVFNDNTVSAREEDPNFLKKVNPAARQAAKVFTLAFAYGMSEYKYASTMKVDIEEAKKVKDLYFKAFPNLKAYHQECFRNIGSKYYVQNLVGRRKRAKLIPLINKYFKSVDTQNVMALKNLYKRIETRPEFIAIFDTLKKKGKPVKNAGDFAYAVKNEYNNALNFPIQGLAASTANASAIQVVKKMKQQKVKGNLILNVHDEITLLVKKEDAERAAKLLQEAMESNIVAKMLSVEMKAEPIIANNLAEAK